MAACLARPRAGPRPARRHPGRVALAGALAVAWPLAAALPAGASSLTGCSGTAVSLDADGAALDAAKAANGEITDVETGEAAATSSNPFVVANDGVIRYQGRTDTVVTDHTWAIKMLGVTVADGGSANVARTQVKKGTFDVADHLPFPVTGLVHVEGDLTGTGGACSGSGYIEVEGNPLTNPVTWMGVVAGGLGIAGLAASLPSVRRPKGAVS